MIVCGRTPDTALQARYRTRVPWGITEDVVAAEAFPQLRELGVLGFIRAR